MVPVTDPQAKTSALPAGRYRVLSRGRLAGGVLTLSAEYDRADRVHRAMARVPGPRADSARYEGQVKYVRPDSVEIAVSCAACPSVVGMGMRAVDTEPFYIHAFRVRPLGGGRVELREALPRVPAYVDTVVRAR